MNPEEKTWHLQEVRSVIQSLESGEQGLSSSEAKRRLDQFGPNELVAKKKESPLKLLLEQFTNFIVVILIIAALVSGMIGEWVESIAIIAIVILAAVLGFVQEYRAGQALDALKKMAAPTASAIRDGTEQEVPANELVPGDIVVLRTGDRVPADMRILESMNLQVNESSLTGESVSVEKITAPVSDKACSLGDRKNMAFMGTLITYGRGKGIVAGTGMSTEFGKIATMIEEAEERKTPLQISLDKTGKWLGIFSLIGCGLIAAFGILKGYPTIEMLIWGAALAVAVIPEALPAVVTISLALGVRRMVQRHALIRNLPAVETLGCTSVICSDKTGTLTRDEMTARQLWASGRLIDIGGVGYTPEGVFSLEGKPLDIGKDSSLQTLLQIGTLCNDTHLIHEDGAWKIQGDSTEGALVVAAAKVGMQQDRMEAEYPRVNEVPFSSERKRMTTIHAMPKGHVAYSKGAPEMTLNACDRIYRKGQEKNLTGPEREEILDVARSMAENALRVLGLAYKSVSDAHSPEQAEQGMVFAGLVGMMDPPREEVKAAIAICEEASIKTVMITGDHKITAMAVARELGLLKEGGLALSGAELDELDDARFSEIVEQVNVYARVSPAHKMRVVDALTQKGYVVAMTGDGINDAPALKKADIGVAMGITGTDVSKEAADMVLTDDNFTSIVAAVEEGRSIFANIKKYLIYLLSGNTGAVLAMVAALFVGLPLPLGAVQILFINLLMDGAPAIALGVEPAEPGIMKQPPRNPKASVFDRRSLIYIGGIGLWIGAVSLLVFNWYWYHYVDLPQAMTMFFATLITCRLANAFNCRSATESLLRIGPFTNKWVTLACGASFLMMLAAIYMPGLNTAMETVPLAIGDWVVIAGTASTVLIIVEAQKFMIRRRSRRAAV
ncbi:MAG: calcium-transporting P-type ATPase, PMR1-type [Dehalococcoidia bacterium]|nr:calcium-transporting P-type ATPase, PMR1-type [Dehalococcoidia bacterium]